MSNKFEILMNQLDMPLEMRNSEAFLNADIEKVLVHKVSRVWEFHFSFANILPIEIFRELQKRLAQEFSKTGNQAIFEIHCQDPKVSDDLLQAYYQLAFEEGPCASHGFKSLYQDLQVHLDGDKLLIEGASTIDTKHFRKNHLPNLSRQLVKYGFPQLTCQVQHSDELTQQQAEYFQA